MRTLALCGNHKLKVPGIADIGECQECQRIAKLIQEKNPCNTCNAHTNDEVCSYHSGCKERRQYENWRNENGWNPQFDPDITKKMVEKRLI